MPGFLRGPSVLRHTLIIVADSGYSSISLPSVSWILITLFVSSQKTAKTAEDLNTKCSTILVSTQTSSADRLLGALVMILDDCGCYMYWLLNIRCAWQGPSHQNAQRRVFC